MGFKASCARQSELVQQMSTIVQCNCGAEYRRTEEKFLAPHTGDAVCTVCGAALESWSESTHVPTYELIERPDVKRLNATEKPDVAVSHEINRGRMVPKK
jgi:hypothetical protein